MFAHLHTVLCRIAKKNTFMSSTKILLSPLPAAAAAAAAAAFRHVLQDHHAILFFLPHSLDIFYVWNNIATIQD
jgi:hypothetical protein